MALTMHYLTYITAGIRNRKGRSLAIAFCYAFIAATIFSGQYLMAGTAGSIEQGISRMGADGVVVPIQYMTLLKGSGPLNTFAIIRAEPSPYRMNGRIVEQLGRVQGIRSMSPQLYVGTLSLPGLSGSPVDVYGIDPATDFVIRPWLQHPLERPLTRGEAILGHRLSGEPHSSVILEGQPFTVAGRLDPTMSAIDTTVFVSLEDAYSLAGAAGGVPPAAAQVQAGDVNAILVRFEEGRDPDRVLADIRRVLPPSSITAIGKHFTLDPVSRAVGEIPLLLQNISAVLVVATFPLVALIAAMAARERQREIGLLRATGATRRVIFSLVLSESLVLATTGGIAGVCASIAAFTVLDLYGLLNSALLVSFRMPSLPETGGMALIATVIVIVLGFVAALLPAYRSSRMNPYEAIRLDGQ